MGTDIHTVVQIFKDGKWVSAPCGLNPFRQRRYSVFAFLADVRNYSGVTPIVPPRGLPKDILEEMSFTDEDVYDLDCCHSYTYLMLNELLEFDYDTIMVDHRCTVETSPRFFDGGGYSEEGVKMTYREFLGSDFFDDLDVLRDLGYEVRILIGFDS